MKNADLALAAKAVEVNKQYFKEALAVYSGATLVRGFREQLDIPVEGFPDEETCNEWLHPDPWVIWEPDRRLFLKQAALEILTQLSLTDNYIDAVTHYILRGEIRHIPANFSISFIPGSRRVTQDEDGQLMTGEKQLAEKIKGEIHDAVGNKKRRERKNAERDIQIVELTKTKGKDRDEEVAVRLTENDENADISAEADRKRVQVIQKVRERTKKRH